MRKEIALFFCWVMTALLMVGCSVSDPSSAAPTEPLVVPGLTEFPKDASSGLEYEVNADGVSCTITGMGDCTDVYVKIPDEMDGYVVSAIGNAAFYDHEEMLGISMGDRVTTIGDYAFFGCSSMRDVRLGEQIATLGKYAFACCRKLERISLPASVESIADWAFFGCNQLKGVYISDLDRWCAISFGSIYANPLICAGELYLNDVIVTEVTIPEEVTYIGDWLFGGCTSLTKVVIHENVTEIHFGGTIAQWRAVSKVANWNFSVKDYVVHCTDGQASE